MRIDPRQFIRRIHATWNELDYAQRRLLEIQSGIPARTSRRDDH
jgi:hypothetical protein